MKKLRFAVLFLLLMVMLTATSAVFASQLPEVDSPQRFLCGWGGSCDEDVRCAQCAPYKLQTQTCADARWWVCCDAFNNCENMYCDCYENWQWWGTCGNCGLSPTQ